MPPEDNTAKALACYGLYLPEAPAKQQSEQIKQQSEQMLLRFVAGRPVSGVTCAFLEWVCAGVAAMGKAVLVLFWDNASWHISRQVQQWIKAHNKAAKQHGGLRLLVHRLPTKSPWLNRIEPKWVHGKRAVLEPERVLSAQELAGRLCGYYACEHLEHLKQ